MVETLIYIGLFALDVLIHGLVCGIICAVVHEKIEKRRKK